MFVLKFLLVASSPFKEEVVINGEVYHKDKSVNRLLYILKLMMMLMPGIGVLIYYLVNKANSNVSMATFIFLAMLAVVFIIINICITDKMIEEMKNN